MGLCLSVCLSVTSRSSTKMDKRRITQTTPYDSPGTLFLRQRFLRSGLVVQVVSALLRGSWQDFN